MTTSPRSLASLLLAMALLASSACASDPVSGTGAPDSTTESATAPTDSPLPTDATPTTGATALPTTTDRPTTTDTPATSSTVTTTGTTTLPATTTTLGPPPVLGPYPALTAAVTALVADNAAISVSLRRVGAEPLDATWGRRVDGGPITVDTPFVIASVSKLITALSVARLAEQGRLAVDAPVPWDAMGVAHDPAWDGVTVRELLDHTSGMPINRRSWLDQPGSCAIPLAAAVAVPPTPTRGEWTYSNGNYCALGLLVEVVTGRALDEAADELVFGPLGITGPYLSTDGHRADSAPFPHPLGIRRLDRLGGAGSWLASSADLATMLGAVTAADLTTLQWPGIIVDQYGWGHTGTVDGAKACGWMLEQGRTVLVAIVAGDTPATGGQVCDRLVPALAADLGLWAGEPVRSPD